MIEPAPGAFTESTRRLTERPLCDQRSFLTILRVKFKNELFFIWREGKEIIPTQQVTGKSTGSIEWNGPAN